VASFCHYSPSFVARLFKARAGVTINDYLKELRMKKASELLTKTDIPISEIAEACGFGDTNYFIAFFSRHYGLPPKKYRMQRR
jgi:two-component system response regulator YesN